MMIGAERLEEDILWTFYETADISRHFFLFSVNLKT